MNILLTGGTGFIGSHTAVVLAEAGHCVVLLDNLCNSRIDVVDSLESIIGNRPVFIQGDIRDVPLLESVLVEHAIDAVIHFAGLKAVGESVAQPVLYYHNNVYGSICLFQAMQKVGVKHLVFSSSATVYGEPKYLPMDEAHPTAPTNPYGHSKHQIEQMLMDLVVADPSWRITSLRYFNPVGAHQSGLIGENPNGIPNNLMPFIAQVATGNQKELAVFGNDYPTPDGTGIRDYIHVVDLAEGHLASLNHLGKTSEAYNVFNLGTGKGSSVLELVSAFERASQVKIPCRFVARRAGDVVEMYAESRKSHDQLCWTAKNDIHAMCTSTWKYQNMAKAL